jgi:RNA polymerase sigma factor (sigma-70 family)
MILEMERVAWECGIDEGDGRAARVSFDEFSRRHRDELYRIALRIVIDPDAAQDAAQDALLRAMRHWAKIDEPLAWCRKAVVRRALSEVAGRRRFAPMPEEPAPDPGLLERLAVERALGRLKPAERGLLALVLGEGWSYREVAEALGIKEGTVGSRLNKAKERFRGYYEDKR